MKTIQYKKLESIFNLLDRERIKQRKDGQGPGGGNYFKYFNQRGAIIQGR